MPVGANLMSNMTVENIGSFMQVGNTKDITERSRIGGPEAPQAPEIPGAAGGDSSSTDGSSFQNMLKNGLDKVNEAQSQADHAVKEMVAGRTQNIHETMLLLEKADMTYKMAMQVRNKIIDAYREVMKMQV